MSHGLRAPSLMANLPANGSFVRRAIVRRIKGLVLHEIFGVMVVTTIIVRLRLGGKFSLE